MNTVTLIGAYGRTYPNLASARKDWVAGKDFKIVNGPYCSVRDVSHMVLRFTRIDVLTDSGVVTLTDSRTLLDKVI